MMLRVASQCWKLRLFGRRVQELDPVRPTRAAVATNLFVCQDSQRRIRSIQNQYQRRVLISHTNSKQTNDEHRKQTWKLIRTSLKHPQP